MAQAQQYTDAQLIEGIRENDHHVLETTYKRYFSMILHFIIQNNGSEQDAKDVYQEAIMIFYEKLQYQNFLLTCQVKTFIYSICRRIWLRKLRDKGRTVNHLEDLEPYIPIERDELDIDESERKFTVMAESLEKLGEPCSTILKDFYIHQKSMQQIADKMGYTNTDNAKNQKYKCLLRLKKIFFEKF